MTQLQENAQKLTASAVQGSGGPKSQVAKSKESSNMQEAVIPAGPSPTISDVMAGLQKLIDTLSPTAPVLQTTVGATHEEDDAIAASFRESVGMLLWERAYPEPVRQMMAKKGQALPDGSFPIANKDDLDNAKAALGRAKPEDRAKVKAHINKRAKALKQPLLGDDIQADEAGLQCASCGNPAARYDSFCGSCGEPLTTARSNSATYCSDCGSQMEPDNDFCTGCGSRQRGTDQSEAGTVEIEGDFIPLVEGAVAKDGTTELKLIAPGWGSSGFYSPEVLKRDGPKAFPKGTKQFWDHPTRTEESERPERSLKDLAAVIQTTPVYKENGKRGPGLYAQAKVFEGYRGPVNEMANDIGVSIRALGRGVTGTAEGKTGRIIEEIKRGQSVDFVTTPGAGGAIVSLFESARNQNHHEDNSMDKQLEESLRKENADLRRRVVAHDAREFVTTGLRKVAADLAEASHLRLTEALVADFPLTEDGELDKATAATKIREAAQAERAYLQEVMGKSGRVMGLGGFSHDEDYFEESSDETSRWGGAPTKTAKAADSKGFEDALAESFAELGLDENVARQAAIGRRSAAVR